MNKLFFTKGLLNWFGDADDKRDLPWKKTNDPYRIWISEIILQQTQVKQGLAYYERFTETFPDVFALANAAEDDVLAMWKGLGYYSRARNLHQAAKYIVRQLGGVFPNNYQEILALKGVGPYSAAAIASFAFKEPKAVVDGNVYRVLSRFFAVDYNVQTAGGKRFFQELADELLDTNQPDRYNQAIMDFGAIVCKPTNPQCSLCPLSTKCKALLSNQVKQFPVKNRPKNRKKRFFNFLVMETPKGFVFEKRSDQDIWKSLYQFPMKETDGSKKVAAEEWRDFLCRQLNFSKIEDLEVNIQGTKKQILSHQEIIGTFYTCHLKGNYSLGTSQIIISKEELLHLAFPKLVDVYIKQVLLADGYK
jgi:A/G-specific adenine glycosylase